MNGLLRMLGDVRRGPWPAALYIALAGLPAVALVTVDRPWALAALVPAVLGPWGIVVSGAILRLAYIGTGFSDPLLITAAARDRVLDGLSPYGVGYQEATIPGASYPYGPLMLLDTVPLEVTASIALLVLLVNRPITLALYAGMPFAISLASSGNNDHLPTLVLVVGLMALPRWWGGALVGLSVAVKPYTAVFVPAVLALGGVGPFLASLAAAVAGWLPALVWGGVLESLAILNAQQASSPLRFLAIPASVAALKWGILASCVAFAFLTLTSGWWSLGYLIPLGITAGIGIEPTTGSLVSSRRWRSGSSGSVA